MRGLLVTALAAAAAGSASAATAPLLLLRSGPELAVEATKPVSYETLTPAKVLAGVLGGGVVGQWQAGSSSLRRRGAKTAEERGAMAAARMSSRLCSQCSRTFGDAA